MNKVLISAGFGLIAIFSTYFTVLSTAYAQNINGQDPVLSGCENDAITIRSKSVYIAAPSDFTTSDGRIIRQGTRIRITVQLRKSGICKAKWARAIIPLGTNLYLKDNSRGEIYASYTAQVSGKNYGNMWNSRQTLQACVSAPFYNGELCTDPG
jgi:hypothetical protein